MTPDELRAANRDRMRAWRERNRDALRERNNERQREWRATPAGQAYTREYNRTHGPSQRQRQKLTVFDAYGGPICVCCGETALAFLTIDHIAGGGNEHRKQLFGGRDGGQFYRWLIKQGFPPGYQVLCFNCNHGKHINGGVCPHEETALRLIGNSA